MAEVKWSSEQLSIIESRNKNLLVCAAAGAGKTTVLVERIFGLISDPSSDIDIDRLLVVTFTKDAAAQMREKIGDRISAALMKEPDNRRLLRQQMLLHNANIMTIDSFCNSVIKEFFHDIDIDPAFRIGQTAELKLLQSSVLTDFIEECYEKHEENFIEMVESYCGSKNDDSIEKLILRLKDAAEAQAWPLAWLDKLEAEFVAERDKMSGMKDDWSSFLISYAHGMLREIPCLIDEAEKLARLDNGPVGYLAALTSDRAVVDSLLAVNTYEDMCSAIDNLKWEKLAQKKKTDDWDADVMERVKKIREGYKQILKKLKESYFSKTVLEVNEELSLSAGPVVTLIGLTAEFMRRYSEAKKQKNVLEFSDLEHFTLDILARRLPDGTIETRNAAQELHERFKEIFVDEYQDSNFVQEQIIEAIAGNHKERPYTFMVGDVKQSIYKFRMAKPELFMNRLATYRADSSKGEAIALGRNFRSRPEVLDATNDVFYLSMQECIGGVTYDSEAALVCGQRELAEAKGMEMPLEDDCKTELILIKNNDDDDDESTNGAAALRLLEAKYAAKRVKALVDSGFIIDRGRENEHAIGYGDIVILLRSLKDWAEVYMEAFEDEGIPIFSDTSAGFLTSYEITAVLNYLRILDNPRQDIPLAAVMKSALCGFTSDELVCIRAFAGVDTAFCDAVRLYEAEGPDRELRKKVESFLKDYEAIRSMNLNRDIDRVIEAIYDRTGFYLYCAALPGGERRASNLDMLMTYAAQYEAGQNSGLFSFVRYIEQILSSEQDLEEAVNADAGDSVRIMSIHKSKGLEFPVVIIGGMVKQFNNMDSNQGIIISSDFGIAAPGVNLSLRTRSKTLRRSVLQLMMRLDNLGEELRLLYVAMTRAKQKLVMIGATLKPEKRLEKWERAALGSEAFTVSYIAGSSCYMDFVYPTALRCGADFDIIDAKGICEMCGDLGKEDGEEENGDAANSAKAQFMSIEDPGTDDVRRLLKFEYQYGYRQTLPVKLSVSDIKRAILEAAEEEGSSAAEEAPWVGAEYEEGSALPKAKKKSRLHSDDRTGADRGILYHKVMQFIPFDLAGENAVSEFLDGMLGRELITPEERSILVPADFAAFLDTDLSKRLAKADNAGMVRREQPFVLARRACDIDAARFGEITEMIPVQGIIDCMFCEDGRYIILDYKTDKARPGQGHILVERYRSQLNNYAEAVSRILGSEISEKLIYSFALKEVIHV